MNGLTFIQGLKQAIYDVTINPSNHIFYCDNDYNLVKKLKSFTLNELKTYQELPKELNYFSQSLLNRHQFNERIKYALIKLNEFNIPKEDQFEIISQGIKSFIEEPEKRPYYKKKGSTRIVDLLVNEIANYFRFFMPLDDIYNLEFAENRHLIYPNPKDKSWFISNLGNYFVQLSTFEAVSFLVALEAFLSKDSQGAGYYHFITKNLIKELVNSKNINNKPNSKFRRLPHSLRMLGITNEVNHHRAENNLISDFGLKTLKYVHNNLDEYKELVLFLFESEASGFKYHDINDLSDFLKFIEESTLLIDDQKKSLKQSIELFQKENYWDSLRIIYPILEGTLDVALKRINIEPATLKGMQGKIEKLEKEKLLSSKVSTGLEIFKSRNKIVHGNLIEEDTEIGKPLFDLVVTYLRKVVTELQTNLNKTKE